MAKRKSTRKSDPKTTCPVCGGTSWATVMIGRIGGCPFEIPVTRQDIIALAANAEVPRG